MPVMLACMLCSNVVVKWFSVVRSTLTRMVYVCHISPVLSSSQPVTLPACLFSSTGHTVSKQHCINMYDPGGFSVAQTQNYKNRYR